MQNLWNDEEAKQYEDELGLRVYTSRLLGRDPSLVLHGGGNTSVKLEETNILGEKETILYVKGSGWDLETIDRPGFAPVRLDHLVKLAELPTMSDPTMVNELKTHMTRASAPTPSVEAILHAILPYRFVDHTHADAVVTLTNTPNGLDKIKEVYGNTVVVIPYVMPGFDLARLCAEYFQAHRTSETIGMVLMNHGIFSFGETAKESYDRMIDLVGQAEDYIKNNNAWEIELDTPTAALPDAAQRLELAKLRYDISKQCGRAMILRRHNTALSQRFINDAQLSRIAQQGPATPDHVIRTKRLPMLGRNLQAYHEDYKAYFDRNAPLAKDDKTMLDSAPRVILDETLGLCTVGKTRKDADIVADIYDHTMEIILRAEKLGGWQALPDKDIFDVEYWDLEQAKLRGGGKAPVFTGEAALVTGAASGIGRACVDALIAQGAAVIAADINDDVTTAFDNPNVLGVQCDITDEKNVQAVLEHGVARFGGIDMVILNAGIFPGGSPISELEQATWENVMRINLDANLRLLRETHPLLKQAPNGGRVVIIGSKNVIAPGPGAAAYSASKAALNQLARVAALEWGKDGIRINSLHPNAVFDTALWTDEVLQARANHYGLSVDEYKRNNVLKTEVRSQDVAELAAAMCGPLFAKTTASQVPVDGGNDRVI